jgi:hypothetical protein
MMIILGVAVCCYVLWTMRQLKKSGRELHAGKGGGRSPKSLLTRIGTGQNLGAAPRNASAAQAQNAAVGSWDLSACRSWWRVPGLGRLAMLEAFAGLSAPLVAGACLRCGVPLRAAPAGTGAVVAGQRVAGRVLPARHYGSADVFLEALGRAGAGGVLVIDNGAHR